MKKKTYLFELITSEDGSTLTLNRINEGFSAFELMGIMSLAQLEIGGQIHGQGPKPDVINRIVVKDKENPNP